MRWAGQRGSATVLVTVLVAATTAAAVLTAMVAGAVVDQRRVEAAADLGALAAASARQRGEDGCAAAASTIRRNGARLAGCRTSGVVVRVRAARTIRSVLGVSWQATSTARAGPVDAVARGARLKPAAEPQRTGGGDW